MLKIITAIAIVVIVLFFYYLYMIIKIENTSKKRIIIAEAIYKYQAERIEKRLPILVNFEDMEDYDKTLHRFWDWGYTRILSKYNFQLIKPYIKEKD